MTLSSDIAGDLTYQLRVPGEPTAGTPNEWPIFKALGRFLVTGVRWVPDAAVTANGTNYFTLNVRNRGAADAGTAIVAPRSYAATNSVARRDETLTLSGTPANLLLAVGDQLVVEKLVAGTGLAMPAGLVVLTLRRR